MEKIFYSWQSDLPNACNRGFIQQALEKAAKSIRNDNTIELEPVIDRDTSGVPGSPDIAHTIFNKIADAQIFVCDISFINSQIAEGGKHRMMPNPNVLIELGYALNALGSERVVMVMNTAFGKIEMLPFDLRMRRVLAYSVPEGDTDKGAERKKLEGMLESALRGIFEHHLVVANKLEALPSLLDTAKDSVENHLPRNKSDVRRYAKWCLEELDILNPFPLVNEHRQAISHEQKVVMLTDAVDKSSEVVLGFAGLSEVVSSVNAQEASIIMFDVLAGLQERYRPPMDYQGVYHQFQFDFFKILAYEMLILLVFPMIRDSNWDLIEAVTKHSFYASNANSYNQNAKYFVDIQSYPKLINEWNTNASNGQKKWLMPVGQFFKEQFAKHSFDQIISFEEFAATDTFLYLHSFVSKHGSEWVPWCMIYNVGLPNFLVRATSRSYASGLSNALGEADPTKLGSSISDALKHLADIFRESSSLEWPFGRFNPDHINSR